MAKAKKKVGAGDVASNRYAAHRFNLLERIECGKRRLGAGCGIDRPQRRGQRLAVFPTGIVKAVADQMHNTGL